MKLAKLTVVLITVFSVLVLLSAVQAEHATFDIPKLDAIIVDGNSGDWDGRGFSVEILAGVDGHILPPHDLDANFRLNNLGWISKYHPKFVDAIVAGINETENVGKPSSSP